MFPSKIILLAAHGAGTGSDANLLVESLAARLRTKRPDLPFLPAYNMGEPRFPEAISQAAQLSPQAEIRIIPLMTGPGYFVNQRLPEELAKSPDFDPARTHVLPPIGTSPLLIEAVVNSALAAWQPGTTLLVVAHGTTRNAQSRTGAAGLASLLASRLPQGTDIRPVYLDEPPLLEDVAHTLSPAPILVLPWLLGGGGHAKQDITERLGPALARATILPPLGDLPILDDVVLSLVDAPLPQPVPA